MDSDVYNRGFAWFDVIAIGFDHVVASSANSELRNSFVTL